MNVNGSNVILSDSFGVVHISEKTEKLLGNKNITTNIYRIQAYDSVMYGYVFIGLIDFIMNNKL